MSIKKEERKLFIHIIRRGEDVFEVAGLSENKILWCILPSEYQNIKCHKILLSKSTIRSAINAIKPINGFRKVGLKIDEDLKKEYFDEEDNLCFKNLPLEEINSMSDITIQSNSFEEGMILMERIKELENKLSLSEEASLHLVEKKFLLEKFEKKQNAAEWIEQFENECKRHKINNNKKIEALRFFLDGSSKDWYESNLKKIGPVNWDEWKSSFLIIFVDKGWINVRKAFNYKYLGGSLVDYALTKERLCLEAEKNATVMSRINLIVVGLSLEIQDELDRETITTMEKLVTELAKLEGSVRTKKKEVASSTNSSIKTENFKGRTEEQKKKISETFKKPCYMCESLGWRNRFHPTTECRNKNLYTTKFKVNLNEAINDSETDQVSEMINIELDNKSLN
ncbi:uncharacterized protein LOC126907531 [Daktulosphaira vitifoliae]|uniref:uncharacterized protein LOC126899358 n=1 Tax=Daktulosphaira vitifoliae TaxID=58002 RepID=UPI0021A9C06A|nr:uncharacterized protein LOC126899358 [Daktulosphaira vitifoliae]XP_050534260.1 uncharacterized protein LOC126901656 [Daktulosphaira vitifoliae]XP_050534261.1 uncharacterized protein LOC126901656 [Daktulosphaira vitifoliae]XP_050541517.1 uncharacterized protein LOC126905640 [Daktulosphaira vitifoliae]XP_050544848.1 uncharacterized protein LOC126907531 [Daktulosphaira vitifoliae]